ncbi:hypothetical protein C4E24_03155 [ANME-1 cluster archaeon AG-394-G21]|nr:hypothetical protein [ANME-1 cluster archaeon AG-394-G21]
MHIITLNCADDTEKKRVRYVIDKWEGDKERQRAKGYGLRGGVGEVAEVKAIIVKADLAEGELGDFIDELYSKISAGQVEIYKAEIEKIEPEKKIERLNVTFKDDIKSVEKLISFIFSKKNTTLREHRYLSGNFSEMVYQVYMRRGKGGVEVRIVLREEGEGTVADIRLEGIEGASKSLKADLLDDFSFFDVSIEEE